MLDNQLDKERLRERLEAEVFRTKTITSWTMFGINAFMFILFMVIMWGMALTIPAFSGILNDARNPLIGLLILPTMGWAIGLLFHLMSLLTSTGSMNRRIRERAMARVLGDEVFQSLLGQGDQDREKAKREGQRLRLGDDGELVPDEETGETKAAKRASRKQSTD